MATLGLDAFEIILLLLFQDLSLYGMHLYISLSELPVMPTNLHEQDLVLVSSADLLSAPHTF